MGYRPYSLSSGAETAHLSGAPEFTPDFTGVRVTRSLALCVCFVDHCLSFCPFSSGHCVVCPSSIYGFWLPLWYLQTLLEKEYTDVVHVTNDLILDMIFPDIAIRLRGLLCLMSNIGIHFVICKTSLHPYFIIFHYEHNIVLHLIINRLFLY